MLSPRSVLPSGNEPPASIQAQGSPCRCRNPLNRAVAPETWLGLVPTACQGRCRVWTSAGSVLVLAGQRALHPARVMGMSIRAERWGRKAPAYF